MGEGREAEGLSKTSGLTLPSSGPTGTGRELDRTELHTAWRSRRSYLGAERVKRNNIGAGPGSSIGSSAGSGLAAC